MKYFPAIELPAPRATLALRDWLLALVFFAVGVGIFSRNADFPSFYHPDEPSKARQILEGEYNFNHPLLLLQATRLITQVSGTPQKQQAITEAGRLASAIFAAAAVALLVLTAAHLRGTLVAAGVGLLVVTNRQLYELAHYFKEDPSLAFGMAAFSLALVRCWVAPSGVRFGLLGAAAALACSGKYVGALVIPVGVIAIWACGGAKGRNGLVFAGGLLVTLLVVNFPVLASLGSFAGNLERETEYAVSGHKGITRPVPHGVYGAVFREATNPIIWVLLAVYYSPFLWRGLLLTLPWIFAKIGRAYTGPIAPQLKRHPAEIALAIFPVVYVLILSFSPKTHHRYFLPDTLIFCTLASMAVLPATWRYVKEGLMVAAIIWSIVLCAGMDAAFQNDARRALVTFVREHVPAEATIVQDKRVNLPDKDEPRQADSPYFPTQPLLGKLFAADVGTIDELRAQGIHYVAVAKGDYGRFFLTTHKPKADEIDDYKRRKAFYEQLFAEGQIVWECEAGPQQYLQPAIKLYYLPPKP